MRKDLDRPAKTHARVGFTRSWNPNARADDSFWKIKHRS